MRRVLACLIAAALSAGMARAQMLQSILAPAPITVVGVTSIATYAASENGIDLFTAIKTGATTYHVLSCTVPFSGHGTAGDHLECGVYLNSGSAPSTLLCYGSYTETGSEPSPITIPLSGCGTLAASTGYWEFINTDDAALDYGTYSCGGTCTGTFPAQTTPGDYFFETYGVHPSSPAVSASTTQLANTLSLQ